MVRRLLRMKCLPCLVVALRIGGSETWWDGLYERLVGDDGQGAMLLMGKLRSMSPARLIIKMVVVLKMGCSSKFWTL